MSDNVFINDFNVTDSAVAPCTALNINASLQQMTVYLYVM